jgi:surface antigen
MILGLATPGLSTVSLRDLVDPIPASQLRRGDLLGNLGPGTEGNNGHVQWVDSVGINGAVTVYEQTGGSVGPHRNTYKRPGFPAWRVRGVDVAAPTIEQGDPDMILIVQKGSGQTFTYNGVWRAYQGSPDVVKALTDTGVRSVAVDDVTQFGIEWSNEEFYADRDALRAHVTAAPVGGPAVLAPHTHAAGVTGPAQPE